MKLYYFHTLSQDTSIYTKIEAQFKIFNSFVNEKKLEAFNGIKSDPSKKKGYVLKINEKNKVKILNNSNKITQVYNWLFALNKIYHKVFVYLIKNNYTHIFIRKNWHLDFFFIHFLKKLKQNGVVVLYEIPTFPYDCELNPKSLSTKLDSKYREKLCKYVDRIITYSNDNNIFGVKTIKVTNGVIVSDQKIVEESKNKRSDVINLIAVAGLAPWHGYDRLLRGLGEYYGSKKSKNLEVIFHLVGDGPVLDDYNDIIENFKIQDRVMLYGKKRKEELDEIYDLADIAVASLGMHRIKIYKASTLKTREYAAKGLPIITSCAIDFIPQDYKYQLLVPANESSIDIEKVTEFYSEIYAKDTKEKIHKNIRKLAEERCDMKIVLQPIIEYINS